MCNPERCARAAASAAGEAPVHARALEQSERPSGDFARAGETGERAPVEGGVDTGGLFTLCTAPEAGAAAELAGGALPTIRRDDTTSIGTTT